MPENTGLYFYLRKSKDMSANKFDIQIQDQDIFFLNHS